MHPAFCEWMLDSLVLADRPIENDALAGVFRRAPQRILTDSDRLDTDQNTLGIEAVEDVAESLALFADPVRFRNEQPVDEDGVGIDRFAAHLRYAADLDLGTIQVGVKNSDTVGRTLDVLEARGSRQQHDLVCDLRRRRPHFLTAHYVAARRFLCKSLDTRGVEPRVGFGEAKAALIRSGYEAGYPFRFLLRRAVNHDRM